MSRISTGDQIVQKPQNTVYTALAAAGFVASLIGLILFILKAKEILGKNLWE